MTILISTSDSRGECVKVHFWSRAVLARFVVMVSTLLASAAAAAETALPAILPDAPSALLCSSFSFAEEASWSCLPTGVPAPPDGSPSQQNPVPRPSILHRAITDQKDIYTAPFHRRNVGWDMLFLAATGGLIAADKHISGSLSRDHVDVSQDISDVGLYSMSAAVAGLWLSSFKTNDDHARETGVLAAEAFANTAAVLGVTQLIAGRERPTDGTGNGRFWQNNALGSSFPSAHSSFTWTMASVVAHEYPKPWVRWLVYGTATTVSVTRVTGLKHFPADVAVGGTFGFLIGQQIFNSHCRLGLSSHCRLKRLKNEGAS